MSKDIDSELNLLIKSWPRVEAALSVYKTKKQYARGVALMEDLLKKVGTNTKHPLYRLLETISVLVENYEEENIEEPLGSPLEALRYLMDEHGLTQADLKKEIGSQGTVSEILSGRRELNKRQIMALSERFNVSPLVFLESGDIEDLAA